MTRFLSLEWDQHSCKKIATTLECVIDKCDYALATCKQFPKAYMEQYVVAKLEGRTLMETTSSKTFSPIAMASAMAMNNHFSNGGNSAILSG
jgi:hypothetical protein